MRNLSLGIDLLGSVLLVIALLESYSNAYTIDPCGSLMCEKPLRSCLILIPATRSFECKCKKTCRNPSIIKGPVVRTLPYTPKPDTTVAAKNADTATARSLLNKMYQYKQPNIKQYGGYNPEPYTPYTQPTYSYYTQPPYTQPPYTQPPYTQPPYTQPPYTQPPYTQPPYNPYTQPPYTQPPYTQPQYTQGGNNCYSNSCMNGGTCYSTQYPGQPTTTRGPTACTCQPEFTGSRCELYTPTQPADGWNNLCRVYTERNMNICQNGGQCVFISDGKVACVCPSTYSGQYCELPVYVQCQGIYSTQCHRDTGTCAADGTCICSPGYCGPKCDQKTGGGVVGPTTPPVTGCIPNYCLNGGTCKSFSADPYVICLCPPGYSGTRCETNPGGVTGVTPPYTGVTTQGSTLQPHCNFTIGLQNDGAYTARFRVQYKIDGVQQAHIISNTLPFIGNYAQVTIPYYATDLVVTLERLGFSWGGVVQDKNIDTQNACIKCYKMWNTVTDPLWDYLQC